MIEFRIGDPLLAALLLLFKKVILSYGPIYIAIELRFYLFIHFATEYAHSLFGSDFQPNELDWYLMLF